MTQGFCGFLLLLGGGCGCGEDAGHGLVVCLNVSFFCLQFMIKIRILNSKKILIQQEMHRATNVPSEVSMQLCKLGVILDIRLYHILS